jgi:CBS domain-containing protein
LVVGSVRVARPTGRAADVEADAIAVVTPSEPTVVSWPVFGETGVAVERALQRKRAAAAVDHVKRGRRRAGDAVGVGSARDARRDARGDIAPQRGDRVSTMAVPSLGFTRRLAPRVEHDAEPVGHGVEVVGGCGGAAEVQRAPTAVAVPVKG